MLRWKNYIALFYYENLKVLKYHKFLGEKYEKMKMKKCLKKENQLRYKKSWFIWKYIIALKIWLK